RGLAIGEVVHHVARVLKRGADRARDGGIVFDYQHPHVGAPVKEWKGYQAYSLTSTISPAPSISVGSSVPPGMTSAASCGFNAKSLPSPARRVARPESR